MEEDTAGHTAARSRISPRALPSPRQSGVVALLDEVGRLLSYRRAAQLSSRQFIAQLRAAQNNLWRRGPVPTAMAHASLQPIEIVKSEQEKVSWLRALLRRKRKDDGKSRVVVFVNTEESALALHKALRKSFTAAVNAGPLAAKGLVAFREGRRLVLITRDGKQPATDLCSTGAATGAVAVSWEAPSSLGAHRARMKTAAGMEVCYQLLVLRQSSRFAPPLDPAYAHALLLSTMLAGEAAPTALQEAAAARDHAQPVSVGERRRRAAAPTQSFGFYHGTPRPVLPMHHHVGRPACSRVRCGWRDHAWQAHPRPRRR